VAMFRPRLEWQRWLATLPVDARDAALEARLGIDASVPSDPPGADLVGYHASGVAPILRMLLEVPLDGRDVFVDLGSGLGKVCLLVALLSDATVRGIELQPALVERARACAERIGVSVRFDHADVREADLRDGTVFFLYVPFTGPVLARVLERLRAVAEDHPIVVCALGVDLDHASYLRRRPLDDFWLAIYDSFVPRHVSVRLRRA